MSCRWRLTPDNRSLPADPINRFWVFSNTPRPALEMYSRRLQSSVTVPWTCSRNAWATGHCAASTRPAMSTPPFGPKSIVSIRTPCDRSAVGSRRSRLRFSKCDPALPALRGILVVHAVHQVPNQMQAQSPGLALLDRQIDVRVGCLRDVERLDILRGQRHFHATRNLGHVDAHRRARGTVFDHVREQLLQRQVHARQQSGVDVLAGKYLRREGEDCPNRVETGPEAPVSRHGRGSRFTRTTVMSSSCRAPPANRRTDSSRMPASSAAGFRWWSRTMASTRS